MVCTKKNITETWVHSLHARVLYQIVMRFVSDRNAICIKTQSILTVIIFLFLSCSEDENVGKYSLSSLVTVQEANVLFEARVSQGFIVYSAPGQVIASCTSDWITLRQSHDTIYVDATTNDGLTGRSALVTLRYNDDVANVTVQQKGVIFRLEGDINAVAATTDEATILTVPYTTNVESSVWSDYDWIDPRLSEDTLYISLTSNDEGHVRKGSLTYRAGGYVSNVQITQYDFEKDIAGEGILYYRSTSDNDEVSSSTNLSSDGFTFDNYVVPLTFDEQACAFYLLAGSYVGEYYYSNILYNLYTVVTDEVYYTYNASAYLTGIPEWDEERGITIIEFLDNGSFSGRVCTGASIYCFVGEADQAADAAYVNLIKLRIEVPSK